MIFMNRLTLLLLLSISVSFGQVKLTKEAAIKMALENNYGIKIANNYVNIAENNASIYNSGYLPTITGNAGSTFNKDNLF